MFFSLTCNPAKQSFDVRPTVRCPAKLVQSKSRRSTVIPVVVVVNQHGACGCSQDALSSRAIHVAMRAEQNRPSAGGERNTATVEVRAVHRSRASHDNPIGAVNTIAAGIDGGEEIVVAAIRID